MDQMTQMIYTGQFGTSAPMQQSGYNPYSNICPMDASTSDYVFQPVQQQYQNYGQVPVYNQPKYDYFNPYGTFGPTNNIIMTQLPQYGRVLYGYPQPQYYHQPQYGGMNCGYQQYYGAYGYGQPYISPIQQQQFLDSQIQLGKLKFGLLRGFYKDITDDDIDRAVNPNNPANKISDEQRELNEYAMKMRHFRELSRIPEQVILASNPVVVSIVNSSKQMHEALDSHSLCQFLEEDLWRLKRDQWFAMNTVPISSRNLSTVYNSREYNELLNMHRSSNPYIGELLNTSRYDNNIDDLEIGADIAFDRARRRQAIFEGKVPQFISSEETQKRRAAWTNAVMNQIYAKGGQLNNV